MPRSKVPPKVKQLVQRIELKNPAYPKGRVWAIAWSVYCKYVRPTSSHCHQKEYFIGRRKLDPARRIKVSP